MNNQIILLLLLAIYLLPSIVARSRRHHNTGAICVLNILLGWTLLGWIAALVWASTVVTPPRQFDRNGVELGPVRSYSAPNAEPNIQDPTVAYDDWGYPRIDWPKWMFRMVTGLVVLLFGAIIVFGILRQ